MRLWHLIPVSAFYGLAFGAVSVLGAGRSKMLHLLVRINDQEQEVKNGERLHLIKGDQLTLLRGSLCCESKEPGLVNFVGFRAKVPRKQINDDLNFPIDTSELKRGWSLDRQGKNYKIEVLTGSTKHGEIMVSILTPELQFLRLQAGGHEFSLKAGQSLNINQDDAIKILSFKANDAKIDLEARVEFKEQNTEDGKKVELQFLYRSYIFASIFLNVESANSKLSRGN